MTLSTSNKSRLCGFALAGLVGLSSPVLAETYTWDGTTDSNWTNGPQDDSLGGVFPANGTTGSNWTPLSSGTPGQLAVPDALTPGGNMIDYQFTGHSWIINNANGTTLPVISEDVQIKLDGGTLDITNSTVSLLPTSATTTANLSGLNLGQLGTATTANFTNSTVNLSRANANGRALGVTNGSVLTLDGTALNITAEAGSGEIDVQQTSIMNINNSSVVTITGDFDLSNSGAVNVDATSTVNVSAELALFGEDVQFTLSGGTLNSGWIRANSGPNTPQTTSFDFQSGAVVLSDANPLRDNSNFEGQFNWTGAAGSGTVTHTDLSNNNNNLAGKITQGYFSIEGTQIDPTLSNTLDWTNSANIDALNAELESLIVNSKFLKLTDTGGQQVLSLEASAIIQWLTDADSNWNTATNWSSDPALPGASDDVLFSGATFTDARTIDVDSNVVVNKLTVSGANQITFDDLTSGSLDVNEYNVSGTHVVAAPLAGGNTTKSGGGELVLTADNSGFSGDIAITGGDLTVTADSALGTGAISISSGAFLNLQGDGAGTGYSGAFNSTLTGDGEVRIGENATAEVVTLDDTAMAGFNGIVAVRGGTVTVDSNTDLGTSTGAVWVNFATGEMQLSNNITLGDTFNIGSRAGTDAHLNNLSGDNTITGSINGVGGDANHNIAVTAGSLTISNSSSTPSVISDDSDAGTFNFDIAAGASAKVGNEADPGAGKITGAVDVRKLGDGTLTIATANAVSADYYTGTTVVEAGTLEVLSDGSLDQGELLSSSITVNSGATLDVDNFGTYFVQPNQNLGGAGTVVANTLAILEGSSLTPGDSIGTLDITGNLNMLYFDSDETTVPNSGALNYELGQSTATGDTIDVTGNLDITVQDTVNDKFNVRVQAVEGTLDAGSHRLINYGGSLSGNGSGTNFAVTVLDNQGNTLQTRAALTVSTATANQVNLNVSAASADLHWAGDNTGVWDVNSGTDFSTDGDNGTGEDVFFDLDNVTFGDGAAVKTVAINNPVAPGSITIDNSAGNDYEFTGANVNGYGDVTKSGTGIATFANAALATEGAVSVTGGRLVLNTDASTVTSYSVGAGATLDIGVTANGTDLDILADSGLAIVNDGTVNVYDSEFIENMTGTGGLVYHEETMGIGDNTGYDGDITVKNGAEIDLAGLGSQNFLGTATGTTTVEAGGTVDIQLDDGEAFTTSENFTLAGAGDGGAFGGAIKNGTDGAAAFNYNGTMTLSGDATLRTDAQGVVVNYNTTLDGSAANATLTLSVGVGNDGSTTNVTGGLDLGTGGLNVVGTGQTPGVNGGTVVISTPATYSGDTNIATTGDPNTRLVLTGTGTLGTSANINVGAGGTLDVSGVGGYTLVGQTLTNDGEVIGNINATAGSTVNINSNNSFQNDVTLDASTATGAGTVDGALSATNGSTVRIGASSIAFVVDQGLIARHNFEPGAELDDSSSNSNGLTLGASASTTTSSAAVGTGSGSLDDAADDNGNRITSPGFAGVTGSGNRTIAFWMNAGAQTDGNATIIGAGTNATGQRFDVRNSGGNLRVEIQGTGSSFTGGTGSAVFDSTWHHVAVVLDGSTFGDIEMFIDGVSIGGADGGSAGNAVNTANVDLYYGDSHNTDSSRNYVGLLDDVQWYNYALSATQIADIFNNPGNTIADTFTFTPETMTVGSYSQDATSTLQVDLVDAVDFDKLAVGGSAALGGGLDLDFEASELTLGDEAVILSSADLTGHFDNAQVSGTALTAVANTAVAVLYENSDADADLDQVRLLATYQGDANGDKKVSLLDLNALGIGFGITGTATWQDGDFNYDGDVSLLDLNALGVTFGNEIVAPAAAPAVPEPASLTLLGLGGLALMRRRGHSSMPSK